MPIAGVSGASPAYTPPEGINQSQSQTGTNLGQQQKPQTDVISQPTALGNGKTVLPTSGNGAAPNSKEPGSILHVVV